MSENLFEKLTARDDLFFETEHLKSDLKGRSIRGGAVTMAAQGMRFFLQTGSTVVLARLLTPEDYGLIAMVTAVTGFVMMFKDMGLSMATIQKAEINHAQISTLFWINVVLSFGVMSVTAALAPVIAWFYGEPRLIWITLALACAFIFGGLTVQHEALLKRQMRFGSLAVIQIVSMLAGIITAIIAAFYGARYWSLVLMQLSRAVMNAIIVWAICGWRPGLPVRRSGVRKMLAFGGNITGFNVVNYFARNFDNILIGKFCGSSQLGLYSKAYALLMLPITQIRTPLNMVALPTLSSLQKEPARFTRYYTKLVSLVAFVSMPLIGFLAVCSDNIVSLLLGNQWLEAADIFRVLALAAFIQPSLSTKGVVLLSLGQSGRYLRFGIFYSIVIVTSFLVGVPWGALGVAMAYTIANVLLVIPSLWYCFRFTPISLWDYLEAIFKPFLASLIAVAFILLVQIYTVNQSDIVSIAFCMFPGLAIYLLVWYVMPRGRSELQEYFSYRKLLIGKKM
jgi:O-antigen/teichoic acid export membrane protein